MKKTLNTIHSLITKCNCPSKLMLAFKNSANLDEAKDEEKIADKVKPCDTKCNKHGRYE